MSDHFHIITVQLTETFCHFYALICVELHFIASSYASRKKNISEVIAISSSYSLIDMAKQMHALCLLFALSSDLCL